MKLSKSRVTSYVIIALVALLIGAAVGSIGEVTPDISANEGQTEVAEEQMTEQTTEEKLDAEDIRVPGGNIFADIAAQVDAGVVLVTAEVEVPGGGQESPFNDPFFEYFFGDRFQMPDQQQPRTREGFGSGFIVSTDGYVVTNEHVIHNANNIEVTIKTSEEPLPAEVVWADYDADLAVLKINEEQEFHPIKMGDSDTIRPGDWSIAIGNPFGFEHTVTTGVISALGRPINIPAQGSRPRTYSNLIQTDAAINPGNSGGPLLNIDGQVIGINTAVSMQGQGIGFAIPINEVKHIVRDLREKGEIVQPWLGIYYGEMDSKNIERYKEYYGLKKLNGVIISKVMEDSPAYEAGLRANDIITKIDDTLIDDMEDVQKIVNEKEIGDTIRIEVIRDGLTKLLFAEIGKRPNQTY
ncbi:MAG: S1C family serine protease [Halanaerobiales bacterium]